MKMNLLQNRRNFITRSIPACGIACILGRQLYSMEAAGPGYYNQESKHKFDQDFRMFTYRQFYGSTISPVVRLLKSLEPVIGKKNLVELVKRETEKNLLATGKYQASISPDLNLPAYVSQFKDMKTYGNILTFEIVEETENIFEMKVSECIYATLYRALNAGEYGYASVCAGDYSWAAGFNSRIKLVRDKTLMEGHDCCNHRYIMD